MALSLSVGWWIVPALLTATILFWIAVSSRQVFGSKVYPYLIDGVAWLFLSAVGICICLAVWLIWALLK